MNQRTSRFGFGIALSLLLVLGAGQARALDVLTFDTGNPDRNQVVGALGFSITQVGSSAVGGLDFSMYDVIYVAQSYEEFLTSSLLGALGSRAGDLAAFVANGGGLVFGSPAVGGNVGGSVVSTSPTHSVVENVDLSTLKLSPLPEIPLLDPVATYSGSPVIYTGELGEGRVVTWNPRGSGVITDESLQLVGNSLEWAAGGLESVPEPGTYALFGLGAAGLVFFRRRMKHKA